MTTPAWANQLSTQFKNGIAHAFILHLNVDDYVVPGARLNQYLSQALSAWEIIVSYDIAHGVKFALPSMERKAKELLGMNEQVSPPSADAGYAALLEVGATAPTEEWPTKPGEALALLERLMKQGGGANNVALILNYADMIVAEGPKATMPPSDRQTLVMLQKWGTDRELEGGGHLIILTTRNLIDIHSDIRAASSKYEALEIPLPGLEERQDYITRYLQKNATVLGDELTPATLANMTAGLSLVHVEDVFLNAQAHGSLSQVMIVERKKAIMQSEFGDVLETVDSQVTFADIGGLQRIKDFFQRRVIRPLRAGDHRRAPMGVLMTGPAGTGKTIMAQAVANESGCNFIVLRIGGKIASMWQGEGERKLMKALSAIKSLTPCLVMIDEIDQVLSRGEGGGNQQNNRIFQILMEFMSDTSHRGQICFLAASNRPDLIDAALKRPGRFDKKIPFLVPDAAERHDIMVVMSKKYMNIAVAASAELLEATEGWTGAELEACAIKAEELIYDGEYTDAGLALLVASKRLKPSTAQIDFMTKLAIAECNDLDLLPDKYRTLLNNRQQLEAELADARPAERGESASKRKGLV